jgi:PilZ domain
MLISLMDKERRTTLRVPFVAHAEITEAGAGVSIVARVSDISKDGCYVDLRSALPQGTSVRIRIRTATEIFEASAVVGYTHPHLGMGLIFGEIDSESQAVLQKWIALATRRQSDDV